MNDKNLIKEEGNKKDNNFIITKYIIWPIDLKKEIQIINYSDNINNSNKKEITESCEIYINNKKITFKTKYIFEQEGEYNIKFQFSKLLTNISCLFSACSSLSSCDLSNFNSSKITNISSIFSGCSRLNHIDFTNW
jgi:surface protein